MAVSQAMRRLLRIREIEEEQRHSALAAAFADLKHLQAALDSTVERERRGRSLVVASARTGEMVDRLAGIEESRAAKHHAAVLAPRIREMEAVVATRRNELLGKRVERRQVETLIAETEAADAIETDRRMQKNVDDWYLNRKRSRRKAKVSTR
jgi:flagellar export protein FliJ